MRSVLSKTALFLLSFAASDAALAAEVPGTSGARWAFEPPRRPRLPSPKRRDWARTPIDLFILEKLEAAGLEPAPPASAEALLRRITIDVTGLPPSPAELHGLPEEESDVDAALDEVAGRLLASPRHGERWARHWLDVARFAESHGFEFDRLRDHAWRYRDYVVDSLNADKPYDDFIREQIAGDALPHPTSDSLVATGFLVAGPWDQAGYTSASALLKERIREEELEDMIGAVGQTFLAMTVHCARCHDHKFDPIPQRDYYRFKAALQGFRHGERPLGADEKSAPRAYAGLSEVPGPTFILERGDVEKRKDPVTAGGLSAVTVLADDFGLSPDAAEGERRRRLAEWIASSRNPLTARVIVNRLWHHHFGRGLVATPNDFGMNGERPTHPELLDWLSCELMENGWRLKHIHGLILRSRVYRQGRPDPELSMAASRVDSENRLLWRYPLRRLEAETVRDSMLHASGELDEQRGGPSFRPFTVTVSGSNFYHLDDGDQPGRNRRTLYRMIVHSGRDPLLDVLDCPEPSTRTPARSVTVTPLQSLALMNNSFVLRRAAGLARRLEREAGPEPGEQVRLAHEIVLGRRPDAAELARALEHARSEGLESLAWVLFNSSEFLHVD